MEEDILKLAKLIKESNKIVFFGGAGVSTESDIRDFRSQDGLYSLKSKYGAPYEVMLSHSYYENHTDTFYKFYKEFMITDAKPNYAHLFLAKIEKYGKEVTIITQNIDGLHQLAGSKNVIELHGSIQRNYCEGCGKFYNLSYIKSSYSVPKCQVCGNIIKPDVVLYEEPLEERVISKTVIKMMEADLLIVAGTSLSVYPAANFINYFYGDNIIVINKEKLNINKKIKLEIISPICETFKKIDKILFNND